MKRAFFAIAMLGGLAMQPAQAEPGLGGEVYGPGVEQGEVEIEARTGYLVGGEGDGEWKLVGEASYGLTDWWRPAVLFELERVPGADPVIEAIAFENVFDFVPTRSWPVHLGLYAEYEANLQSAPDQVEFKLLMQHETGPLRLRLNLITERKIGSGASNVWEYGYAAQALYEVKHGLAIGVEGFGDAGDSDELGSLSDHAHYIGPVAEFEAFESEAGEMEVLVGYLIAVGETESNGQLKLTVEWEF